MRGGAGMRQDKTMRGRDEDPIFQPRPVPLPSLITLPPSKPQLQQPITGNFDPFPLDITPPGPYLISSGFWLIWGFDFMWFCLVL